MEAPSSYLLSNELSKNHHVEVIVIQNNGRKLKLSRYHYVLLQGKIEKVSLKYFKLSASLYKFLSKKDAGPIYMVAMGELPFSWVR